jgi:hypothetical protein
MYNLERRIIGYGCMKSPGNSYRIIISDRIKVTIFTPLQTEREKERVKTMPN